MTRSAIRRGVAQTHSFENARVISRRFEALNVNRHIFQLPLLRRLPDSAGQCIANVFSKGDFVKQFRDGVYIPIIDFIIDAALFGGFNRKGT